MIMKAPPDGRVITTLASDVGPGRIAVDNTSVYKTDYSGGRVIKVTPK
jgi:hypothetical protein